MFCSCFFFFFKQKTAYEIPRRDWSSDVCSSDLRNDAKWRPGAEETGRDAAVRESRYAFQSPGPQVPASLDQVQGRYRPG